MDCESINNLINFTKFWIIYFSFTYQSVSSQSNCPIPWQSFQQTCYLFNASPMVYTEALASCNKDGAALVSVNNLAEHNFIVAQLTSQNIYGDNWYTSGVMNEFYNMKWEGDGSNIEPLQQWWYSDADRLHDYRRIVYKTEGGVYGWSREPTTVTLPFICEITQTESYLINSDVRDFTYGTNISDPVQAPRGPVFIIQPHNIVAVADSRATTEGEHYSISIECMADGNPQPTYTIYQTKGSDSTLLTPFIDNRYTITGGRLVILNPVEDLDAGIYQCHATNEHGTAISDMANITFGVLESFSNVQRAPVEAEEFQSALIECDAPTYKPAVSYQWQRGMADFVRPDLNPHTFISSNGKLYFSEVTQNDENDYSCIVKLTSGSDAIMTTEQPPSKVSLPIPLQIIHQVPAKWGPVIADGFIASYPDKPLRGYTIKLECLAYGTLPLLYSWMRQNNHMPIKAYMSDSNRILEIPNVQLEDAGDYFCTVVRETGAYVTANYTLNIETRPYFLLPLTNQHADIGSQLTWRCEAKAIPRAIYFWYKDGVELTSIPGEISISSNVITFVKLDQVQHNGVYQCTAFNSHGVSYSTAQLRVLAFAPSFVKRPLVTSQSAAIGSEVIFKCSPEASPKPEYTWSRNGQNLNLPENDELSRIRKLSNGDMFISEVQTGDAGRYGCMATNIYGSVESYGNLEVVANTVITVAPVATTEQINNTAVLLCQASFPGNADSIYTWNFNGRPIDMENHLHYRLGTTSYPGALYIREAHYEHAGVYTCVAKTTYDSVTASATFAVHGPPGEPAGVRVETETVTSTSANVIWIEGQTHGRPIEFHNIEGCTVYNNTWVVLASYIPFTMSQVLGTDKHLINVQYLKPGNGHYFRVRAINALGVGAASKRSVLYQIPGAAPTKYPDSVGGGGGSVGTLTITWNPLPPDEQAAPGIGYIVYWRRKGTVTKFIEVFKNGSFAQHTVTVGKDNYYLEYEVKVAAFNNLGNGPVSPEAVFIFSAEELPIGVVTNLYSWQFNSTALWVSWDVIPNDREHMRGTLLGYQVNFKLRDVEDASLDAISWRGETSQGLVIGLDVYTWYTVDVQVLNTAGMGPRGEVYHAKTYKQAPILYPTEIEVFSNTAESVYIKWRGVSTTVIEENLEGCKVRYWQTTDDIRSATDVITERGVTEVVVHGIQKDTIYECRVMAYSRGGDGKMSSSIHFTRGGLVAFDPSSSEVLASADRPNMAVCFCLLLVSFVKYIQTCLL